MRNFKITLLIFFALVLPLHLSAFDCFDWNSGWNFQVRGAYFYPSSDLFRKVFPVGGAEFQIELDKDLGFNFLGCGFEAWANFDWFSKNGHTDPLGDRTHIRLLPLNIGIKYIHDLTPCLHFYGGFGVCYTWLRIENDSILLPRVIEKQNWGGVSKGGVQYDITCNTFIDLFMDYFYQPFSFPDFNTADGTSRNLGGYKVGAGLGVRF